MGLRWLITAANPPHPDFIVTSSDGNFGLEVTCAHTDNTGDDGGSSLRRNEAANGRWLSDILEDFEARSGSILDLKFLGTRTPENREFIKRVLRNEDFEAKPIGHRLAATAGSASMWATKSFVSGSTFLKDTVGWVAQDPAPFARSVESKVTKLTQYRQSVSDVRLLVVANRRMNSGKIAAEDAAAVQLCGFDRLYLFSLPSMLIEVSEAGAITHR